MPAIRLLKNLSNITRELPIEMTKVEVYSYSRRLMVCLALIFSLTASAQYKLTIQSVDRDSIFLRSTLASPEAFRTQLQCLEYIQRLPELLKSKGYPNASVDSVYQDSLSALAIIYVGEAFRGATIVTDSIDDKIINGIGWNKRRPTQTITFKEFETLKQKILEHMENNGYPFARVDLDSVQLTDENFYGVLRVTNGPLYKIDSIRNHGSARISSAFLQHHLNILNGSIYRKEKLQAISRRLTDLTFVTEQQPWDLTLLATGSILNMYLVPKKSSQVNVLVGFLPSNDQLINNKLLITGEANVNLKNALGGGETIGLNWQQIQVKSPRLNILFQQPYLFNTPFGVNFNFDLLKKDSSYVNINLLLGVQYAVSSNYVASVYLQNFTTNLLTVDTFLVKNTRRLPQEADLRSVNIGINLEWFNTDYRFNPRSGNDVNFNISAGTKRIRKNNVIVQLHDRFDPDYNFNSLYDTVKLKSYQFRIKFSGAHYFRLTRSSTIKTALTGGWFQSPNIFRNELFQIGGYKLLRGFDEESIFASQYGVGTIEYRYLIGQNSFLFTFVDGGWARNAALAKAVSNTFIGAGLGMAFETRAGIFNISYAGGKRDDSKFNLRQSKIHIGYVNYF